MLGRMRRQLGHFRLQVSFVPSHILDPFSATEAYRAIENHTHEICTETLVESSQASTRFLLFTNSREISLILM